MDNEDRGYSANDVHSSCDINTERARLRDLLLAGAHSPAGTIVDAHYFDQLRQRILNSTQNNVD